MIKVLFGIIAGIVSGLGMGGGTILIILLSDFLGVSHKIAQATNLVFFIPTSIIASIINIKNKKIDYKVSFLVIIFGIIGSLIGAFIATKLENKILRKFFSIFLILISIYESYNWYKKFIKRHNSKKHERK